MTREEFELCLELMQQDLERKGPPTEFDHRGCRAVLCMAMAFWMVVGFVIAWAVDFSIWEYLA